jgi:hypothetical protein
MTIHGTSHGGISLSTVTTPRLIASGEIDVTGEQTYSTTGTSNDIALNAGVSVFRYTGNNTATLTGFTGGVDGRLLYLINAATSNFTLTLGHQTGSASANQINGILSNSISISFGGGALLRYEAAAAKWRVINVSTNNFFSSITSGGVTTFGANSFSSGATTFNHTLNIASEQADTSTGTVNDFALTSSVSVLRWNGASPLTLTGITGGANGRLLIIVNESAANALGLNNESASSTAANRIVAFNSASQVVTPGGTVILRYDGTASRWRLLSVSTSTVSSSMTFTGTVSMSGNVRLQSVNAPTSISGTNNDWAPTVAYRQRISASAAAIITGLTTGSTTIGQVQHWQNISSFNITLTHEGAGSTAANRFACPSSVDLVIPPGASTWLIYDSTLARWVVAPGVGCYLQASNTLLGDPTSAGWTTGRYYYLPTCSTSTAVLSGDVLRAVPFYVPNRVTISSLACEVTVAGDAGCVVRMGIYGDDGTLRPSNLIVDAGTVTGDSVAVKEITGLSATIGPGVYWAAAVAQSVSATGPTVRAVSTTVGVVTGVDAGGTLPTGGIFAWGHSMSGVTGALPTFVRNGTLTSATIAAARLICKI